MEPAKYLDGEAQNLEAAANDALEWMKFWQEHLRRTYRFQETNVLMRRQQEVIWLLEKFLPKEPPIFEETPRPPLYDAVAELAISPLIEGKEE